MLPLLPSPAFRSLAQDADQELDFREGGGRDAFGPHVPQYVIESGSHEIQNVEFVLRRIRAQILRRAGGGRGIGAMWSLGSTWVLGLPPYMYRGHCWVAGALWEDIVVDYVD